MRAYMRKLLWVLRDKRLRFRAWKARRRERLLRALLPEYKRLRRTQRELRVARDQLSEQTRAHARELGELTAERDELRTQCDTLDQRVQEIHEQYLATLTRLEVSVERASALERELSESYRKQVDFFAVQQSRRTVYGTAHPMAEDARAPLPADDLRGPQLLGRTLRRHNRVVRNAFVSAGQEFDAWARAKGWAGEPGSEDASDKPRVDEPRTDGSQPAPATHPTPPQPPSTRVREAV